ncbi:MAG: ATP-binding cassette domain-containing protein [Holosporaceae bacterium]|jgi:polar amino acid transport system ATP-binding protein|nr:ATP-binding cassette domain-containing protein [Holosporaceae bacterium]
MLKIHNLHKTFKSTKILDGISLEVEKSRIFGLAGPSGSGKSTLLRCIQQLEVPDCGFLECGGKTGFMFQDFQLFPHMTVLENLLYATKFVDKKSNDKKESKKNHMHLAQNMLKKLSIEEKAGIYPRSLSGGQKQRVALARSLMIDPDIFLCDEPTSGLDVATIQDVVQLLKSVNEVGVTMIIASHDLDFLTKISDRIVLLKEGRIAVDIDVRQQPDPAAYLKRFYAASS